jgi:hypothetical protein
VQGPASPAVRSLRAVSSDGIFGQLALAELSSPLMLTYYDEEMGAARAARLRGSPHEEWSPADRAAVEGAARKMRGGYLDPILALEPDWYTGVLEVSELPRVRLIRLGAFLGIAPNRRLDQFVAALDAGGDTSDDGFGEKYRLLRPNFDPARMRGLPILVAEREEGPYTEVEGLTRMSCPLSKMTRREAVPDSVSAILGVSPRICEWNFY